MRIAIVGSRTFSDYDLLKNYITDIISVEEIDMVVSGGAKGADTLGMKFAQNHDIELKEYKPDWEKYGRAAGFARNKLIIDDADAVFVFWDGISKGTKHDIDLAKKAEKELHICLFC